MFSMDSIYGYQDHIFSQMKNIDDFYMSTAMGKYTIGNSDLLSNNKNNGKSLYNRNMEKVLRMADDLYKDYGSEIKTMDSVIKKLSNSSNKIKYEIEARGLKHNLMGKKADLLKMMADMETKIKKGNDDDLKLQKDLTGSVDLSGIGGSFGANTSTSDTFMANVLTSEDNGNLYNINPMNTYNSTPSNELDIYEDNVISTNKEISVNTPKENLSNLSELNSYEEKEEVKVEPPKPANNVTISDEVFKKAINVDVEKDNDNNENIDRVIVNALGERVPVYKEYNGDFKDGTMSSAKKSLENIQIKDNPDIREFFKYNKEEKKGYMVFYNEKTGEEVQGGTHLPLKLLYPFKIDLRNDMVSTALEYDFPIVYTKEPIPKEISAEWDTLEDIYKNRENSLQEKRNESIVDSDELEEEEEL